MTSILLKEMSLSKTPAGFPNFLIKGIAGIAVLSGILFLLRMVSNLSLMEPLQLITSGSEEQSFLSLWKFLHDQPVYSDPHQIPFTSSYQNWLFYGFYGSVMKLANVSDAWIPTAGRMITLFFSALGFWAARLTLSEVISGTKLRVLISFAAFYVFFGPLPAFWPLTVRPDIAAAALELIAFYVFLKGFQNRPLKTALVASFIAFAAWSFKQTHFSVILSLIVFSFFRDRRHAMVMAFIFTGLCGFAVWIGGPLYRQSIIFAAPVPGFSFSLGMTNFFYYLAECAFALPGYAAMALVFFSKTCREKIRKNEIYQLGFITALVTSLQGALSAIKVGASENYFIPAGIFLTIFFFMNISEAHYQAILTRFFSLSLLMNTGLILVIMLGIQGHVSKFYEHRQNTALFACAQELPKPVYSQTDYLNLPWMLGRGQHSFVPGYTYWVEKNRNQIYEKGGMEGLMEEGYFASLLLEKRRMPELAGVSLKKYAEQPSSCPSTHTVWIKTGTH